MRLDVMCFHHSSALSGPKVRTLPVLALKLYLLSLAGGLPLVRLPCVVFPPAGRASLLALHPWACFFFFFEQVAQPRCAVLCSCSPFLCQILLYTTPAAAALLQNGSSEPHGVMQRVNCGASQAQLATARRSQHAQPKLASFSNALLLQPAAN